MFAVHALRWAIGLILLAAVLFVPARGDEPAPPVQLTAQQDHRRTMELLHIKELRQGANGRDRNAPNAANYDEAKVNPHLNLPDPLVLKSGQKVTTPDVWWKQR